MAKRQRERARQAKKLEKAEKRALRIEEKKVRQAGDTEYDPDLEGIVPGPQPPPEE
jgi:hypothetical protein